MGIIIFCLLLGSPQNWTLPNSKTNGSTNDCGEILEAFGDRPNASIPAALGGRNELEAAYRFFDNEKVTPAKRGLGV